MDLNRLKYATPLQSFVDTTFFQELSRIKLDILKLSSEGQKIYTSVNLENLSKSSVGGSIFLNSQSFDQECWHGVEKDVVISGTLYNFNTIEEFKSLDKQKFLEDRFKDVWERSKHDINQAVSFDMISFADLKRYKFYYWLCVTCFIPQLLSVNIIKKVPIDGVEEIQKWFNMHSKEWVCLLDKKGHILKYSVDAVENSRALCIRDTSNVPETPSTLTKNFLSIFNYHYPAKNQIMVNFIRTNDSSFAYDLKLSSEGTIDRFKVSGWERNAQGKLLPRVTDLSALIDPLKIADQSVDLNLKLMKWRVAPEINLKVIKEIKVLILGAGTLGCYVSRTLMAWGVRTVTLVDNSTVSFSNPVRQSLFGFDDVGKPKAETAANALKKVFPLMDATGVELSIPMIGHPITNEEKEKKEFEKLYELIKCHDVIFLLMDSRETRWLPAVLANVMGKVVINAALGFDSYLVMRHGIYDANDDSERLGCYFCNDVVVPMDSLTDKTLDQMCTVTRPGVALLAAAQAVELLVSLLQQKAVHNVPAGEKNFLGCIPHQIRGFLNEFTTLKLETPAYKHCSACSSAIVQECEELGWEFVKNSLNNPDYIEELSGLRDVKREVENLTEDITEWNIDEEEEFDIIR
ncbi:hypothetical protein KAFR_0E02280 [Kazachstania africana CBS 2517]|uniref:Ubiquitin-like modifier-activating enzyme ATG7 n=1 Tax=Kazachstania africana (strain ATCC 22294 / BCRC 22015 / CBS 2517 / CECT 1963 / NBRC 1671 / NRRL Y-8276) TaxID=1071382 RepID=H2AVI1_KAZAF|nr:hypothetical protein KAFR_0E02280 [Kazachstania africana CBS 2517]CCF58381.1 hypothetical protein KAFR_0E02280 [Kazachstania africana CBS 2517]